MAPGLRLKQVNYTKKLARVLRPIFAETGGYLQPPAQTTRSAGAAVCPRPPPLLRLLNHNLEEVELRAVGVGRDLRPLTAQVVRDARAARAGNARRRVRASRTRATASAQRHLRRVNRLVYSAR